MRTTNSDVVAYYTKSAWLYRVFWSDATSRGLHYGYKRKGNESFQESMLSAYKDFLDWVKPTESMRVLDAGCGVGGASLWMAEHARGEYVGISITPFQIEEANRARSHLSAEKQRTVAFAVMDYKATSFPDAYFDAVYAQESFCHAYPDTSSLFREMYRVLKPGGRLFMIDGALTRQPANDKERELTFGMCYGWRLGGWMTVDEVVATFSQAGFRDTAFEDKRSAIVASTLRMYTIGILARPMMWLLRVARLISDEEYGNVRAIIDQKHAQDVGLMTYGIFRAIRP